MKRLIIDADPGNGIPGANIDDAFAIALALTHTDVELLGVTTVAGNVKLEDATACALQLLEIADRTDVPVCRSRAAVVRPTPFRMAVGARRSERVKRLWYGVLAEPIILPSASCRRFPAGNDHLSPGEITLVTVGPLTSIASTLQIEPDRSHPSSQ